MDKSSAVMVEIVSGKIELKMDNIVIKDLLQWIVDDKQGEKDKPPKETLKSPK